LVIQDLLQSQNVNVLEFIHRVAEPNVTVANVLASMLDPSTLCNMQTADQQLYGALDIPMSKKGLGRCNFIVSEYVDTKKYYIPKKLWTTTYTPSGAITHTHMDYYSCHQFLASVWL